MMPARSGERSHEATIRASGDHCRQFTDVATAVMPTTAPTMACVVETGIAVRDDRMRNTAVASKAAVMPSMKRDMRELQ